MAAVFWVTFDNGEMLSVSSADAKSMKRRDLTAATRKAIGKAKEKMRRAEARRGRVVKAKVTSCRCVG